MALFKIEKGLAKNLTSNRPNTVEGYCYVTTDDGKFYIDIATGTGTSGRIVLNAAAADKLTVADTGSSINPVYFKDGVPVRTTYTLAKSVPANAVFTDTTYGAATSSAAGLMSAEDKAKLDGIASGATANTGDITGVTAGNGLTGGGTSGSITLNVGAGTGISVSGDAVAAKLKSTTALTLDASAATTTSGRVYPVAVDKSGYLAVNVPWSNTNTTYTAGAGLSLSGTQFKHTNSITSKTTYNQSTASIGYGETFKITEPKYDAQGHITGVQTATITFPAAQTIPTLSGGTAVATDAKVIGGVTVSGHTITAAQKTLSAGTNVTVTGGSTAITISAKDTTYTAGTGLSLSGTTFNHAVSITAGSVGAASSPSHGGTFSIPKITYDAQGHITGATTVNITLPADSNTDTKVTQASAITTNAAYPVLLGYNSSTAAVTNTVKKAAAFTYNPSTQILNVPKVTATTFTGSLSGKATSAGTADSATKDASGNIITSTYETKTNAASTYETKTDAATKLSTATAYTDTAIAELINGAPTTLDTLKEIADAMEANDTVVEALDAAVGSKSKIGHTHTASYTPAGTIAAPAFTGSAATSGAPSGTTTVATSTHTHGYTPAGTISATFTGTAATISTSYKPVGTITAPAFTGTTGTTSTPSGTVKVGTSNHTHSVTASGTVAASFTGTAASTTSISGTTSFSQITAVGTLPTLTESVSSHCLILTFSAGTLPTKAKVTVANSTHTHGYTPAGIVAATFTGSAVTSGAPSGTVSVPTYNHTHGFTPTGTVAAPTFTGTSATISAAYTPAGTISATFTGTAASTTSISGTVKVGSSNHTHSVTAKGTVAAPVFTGTAATITTNGSTE